MKTVIGAAIIQDRKILLVRKKQTWILPGGRPEPNESDLECLCREVRAAFSGTELEDFTYYGSFAGMSPSKKDMTKVVVYLAGVKGRVNHPSAEITEYSWMKSNATDYLISDITSKIMDSLRKEGYL